MANPGYVRSTDGNDFDNGSTWALANLSLAGASGGIADAAAGDRIFLSQVHAESLASALTIAMPGTISSPNQILCANDGAEPPTALATGATIATTGANPINITGYGYFYGVSFTAGSGAVNANINFGGTGSSPAFYQKYDNCNFILGGTGAASGFFVGPPGGTTTAQLYVFENCGFKFGGAAQAFTISGTARIRGGSALSGGTAPTNVIEPSTGEPIELTVDGFDFTNWGSSYNILLGGAFTQCGSVVLRNCKMHSSSWSGGLVSTALTLAGIRAEMWNCDAGDTNYRLWVEEFTGSIRDETTLVRSSGASDGDAPLAWKMVSSANAVYPHQSLRSPEIFSERITSVGSSKTATVEILHDSATALKDDEVWVDVQYLGTSGFPLGAFANDSKADVLASGVNQSSSSVTWTTTGMSNPNKQKLEVTFTPQEKGVVILTVRLAKASYTVYVDPVVTIS